MNKVINLHNFRRDRRKAYLKRHGQRLDTFIGKLIKEHLNVDHNVVFDLYFHVQQEQNQESWDYLDLRESIESGLAETIADGIYQELRTQYWFDPQIISLEEVVDRCLSLFLLPRSEPQYSA